MDRGTKSNIPLFVFKLWELVNKTSDLIHWSKDGQSFIIERTTDFAQKVIPQYFRHKSLSSFVRQLNMYGFRKVTPSHGAGLRSDSDQVEFAHPNFIRGQVSQLSKITRKLSVSKNPVGLDSSLLGAILSEIQESRAEQVELRDLFEEYTKRTISNEQRVKQIEGKLTKYSKVIKSLAQVLINKIQPIAPPRNFMQLALENEPSSSNYQSDRFIKDQSNSGSNCGPIIHEVTHIDDSSQPGYLDELFGPEEKYKPALSYTDELDDNNFIITQDSQANNPVLETNPNQALTIPFAEAMPLVHSPDGSLLYDTSGDELVAVNPLDVMPGVVTRHNKNYNQYSSNSQGISNDNENIPQLKTSMPDGQIKNIKLQKVPRIVGVSPVKISQKNNSYITPNRYGKGKQIVEPRLRMLQRSPNRPFLDDPELGLDHFDQQVDIQEKSLDQLVALLNNVNNQSQPLSMPIDEYKQLMSDLDLCVPETVGNELSLYTPEMQPQELEGEEPAQKRLKLSTNEQLDDYNSLETPKVTFEDIIRNN